MTHRFDPTSLREYDIRGIVGQTLGPDDARVATRRLRSDLTTLEPVLDRLPPVRLGGFRAR